MARIISLDPGTLNSAWVLYDSTQGRILDYGTWSMKAKVPVDQRLEEVPEWLRQVLPEGCNVDVVVVEKMFSSGRGSDAPLAVFAWMVRCRAHRLGIPCTEIPRSSVLVNAYGHGRAEKGDLKSLMEFRFNEEFPTEDVADAVALAVASVTYTPKKKKPRTHRAPRKKKA